MTDAIPPVRRKIPMSIDDFEDSYKATPPWEIGRPQPALAELFDAGQISGRVLDVGCGTGELTMLAASRGHDAVGVDAASRAVDIARQRAAERGSPATFVVADARDLRATVGSDARFDTAVDSGVFHVFDDADRARYVASVADVLSAGGRYHLLVFSDAVPPGWGPRRISRDDLDQAFAGPEWAIEDVVERRFELAIAPGSVEAWRATITRSDRSER